MDAELSKRFSRIQIKLFNAIKSHQVCYEKLQNGDQSNKIKDELLKLKKQMLQCNEEQKVLLHELNNQVVSEPFTFNMYKIPPAAIPKKNRRRKDQLPGKIERKVKSTREAIRTRSPSLSSTTSDSSSSPSSSDTEEECEKMKLQTTRATPKLTNMSLRSRPTLLPKKKQEAVKMTIPEVKPRNVIALAIERYYRTQREKHLAKKEGTVDEKQGEFSLDLEDDPELPKITFMTSLNLIPKEIAPDVMEMINRKTERKRRSTASNQFVYNNDWELPITPRPKQYLSPVKCKTSPAEDEKPASLEETGTDRMGYCPECGTTAIAVECTKCLNLYHPKCPKVEELMQSFLKCPKCFIPGSMRESDIWMRQEIRPVYPSEEIEKCAKVRDHLKKLIKFREMEKNQLEKTVLKHTDNIVLQKKVIDMQIKDGLELERKIQKLRKFILLFRPGCESKADEIDKKPDIEIDKKPSKKMVNIEAEGNDDIAEMDTQPVSPMDSLVPDDTHKETETNTDSAGSPDDTLVVDMSI